VLRTRFAVVAILAIGTALGGRPAAAADPAWAAEIPAAKQRQDADKAAASPKSFVMKAEQASDRDKSSLVLRYLLARAYALSSREADALVVYGEVLSMDPRCWYALHDRGILRYKTALAAAKGDPSKIGTAAPDDAAAAEKDLRQAVTVKPDYLDALQALAAVQYGRGAIADEIKTLSRILDVEPGSMQARYKMVEAYLGLNQTSQAESELRPLLAAQPKDPQLRMLQARVRLAQNDANAAKTIYRQLAEEFPNSAVATMALLQHRSLAYKTNDRDAAIWSQEALRRIVKTNAEREKISAELDKLRHEAAGGEPSGPPTAEQLVALMNHDDPAARKSALVWIWRVSTAAAAKPGSGTPFPAPVLMGVIAHTDARHEPVPENRVLALRALEKYGTNLSAIVRQSLRDADLRVRLAAVDALVEMNHPLGIGALAPHAFAVDPRERAVAALFPRPDAAPDEATAGAARTGVYLLAHVAAPTLEDETPAAQEAAFRAWWGGAESRDAKLHAIDAVYDARDLFPEQVLAPFLSDADDVVRAAAYHKMRAVAEGTKGAGPRGDWWRSLPVLSEALLTPGGRAEFASALAAWLARSPR
jgi:tetratricopeptide (TPR) repeat protein